MVCVVLSWSSLEKSQMATTTCTSATVLSLSTSTHPKYSPPVFYPNFSKRNFSSNQNPRLKVSHKLSLSSRNGYWVPVVSCGNDGKSEINAGAASPSSFSNNSMEPSINMKLPRRSLLVQFTCNACGERTERLINRLAYERGTVFVQCAGCLQHHKLMDNLGLVVEYDFRKDVNEE